MITMRRERSIGLGSWRVAVWRSAMVLLILPFVAMHFTNEVQWDAADFAAAALLLFGIGAVTELACFVTQRPLAR